jgi:hypothetical protein
VCGAPRLGRATGAAKPYYDPRAAARKLHAAGLYLIGRVVTFQDPDVAEKRPRLALRNPDGSIWHTQGGLGWLNPYDRRVWAYDVAVAKAAVRAGFDEIQFDYVRFPSDGDLSAIRYPVRTNASKAKTVTSFVRYASRRLHALHARISVDVFGLAATGISASGRSRNVSRATPMPSIRWSTRRTSTPANTASRIRVRIPARRSRTRSSSSRRRCAAPARTSFRGSRTSPSAASIPLMT